MPEAEASADVAYPAHLQRVSRSFAPCIAELVPPLREWVGLAYLLCRVLDTVEDAPWVDATAQQQHFGAFLALLETPPCAEAVTAWAAGLPRAIAAGEAALLADAPRLLRDLYALPDAPRAAMSATLRRMARGMAHFSARRLQHGHVRLHDLGEVNRYCFVVAGVVGQLLTELLACSHAAFDPCPAMRRDGVHFGLFLQKINLLKDEAQDATEGRFWLPDRAAVRDSLHRDAQGATRYLLALPREVPSFRLFCAFSLVLGAASLPLYGGGAAVKLPRAQALALLEALRKVVPDDVRLAAAVHDAMAQAFAAAPAAPTPPASLAPDAFAQWLRVLGPTQLAYTDAAALGLA